MTNREKIADKIRKLLALSKSDNQHEAELAAQRANELMTKHQIEMSEVDIEDMRKSGIVHEGFKVEGQKMKLLWVEQLAFGIALMFDSTVLINNKLHGTSFTFVGHREDIDASKALFQHLYDSWFSIVKADLKLAKSDSLHRYTPADTMKFKAGHGLGYSNSIFYRCAELKRAREEQVTKTATGTELVVMKSQALAEHGRKKGWSTSKKAISSGSSMGRSMGTAAGNAVPLGGAIT